MSIRIKLVSAQRYSFVGELFEKGFEYDLSEEKAKTLLAKQTDTGLPFFVRVEGPPPVTEEIEVEETTESVIGSTKIVRKRGKPKVNPVVKTSGDTKPLDAEDELPDEGVSV
jgi:hypothetical protein